MIFINSLCKLKTYSFKSKENVKSKPLYGEGGSGRCRRGETVGGVGALRMVMGGDRSYYMLEGFLYTHADDFLGV